MRDSIIIAINDEVLQQRLLRDPELTLKKATESCRAAELSKQQQRTLKLGGKAADSINVDALKKKTEENGGD